MLSGVKWFSTASGKWNWNQNYVYAQILRWNQFISYRSNILGEKHVILYGVLSGPKSWLSLDLSHEKCKRKKRISKIHFIWHVFAYRNDEKTDIRNSLHTQPKSKNIYVVCLFIMVYRPMCILLTLSDITPFI